MDSIVKMIQEKGQRFTPQKKEVFCVLQKKPQTVIEILTVLKSKRSAIDKATVYRILTGFKELGIVKEIHLGDKEVRFELAGGEHHHHLICEECGSIEDVSLSEDVILKEVEKQTPFQIKRHSLEFFGICKKCQ